MAQPRSPPIVGTGRDDTGDLAAWMRKILQELPDKIPTVHVIISLAQDLPECHEVKHHTASAVDGLEVHPPVREQHRNMPHARV
jgi:hypothetical protein